jgi:hypothetical protein
MYMVLLHMKLKGDAGTNVATLTLPLGKGGIPMQTMRLKKVVISSAADAASIDTLLMVDLPFFNGTELTSSEHNLPLAWDRASGGIQTQDYHLAIKLAEELTKSTFQVRLYKEDSSPLNFGLAAGQVRSVDLWFEYDSVNTHY